LIHIISFGSLINILNFISIETGVYIPLSVYLLEILESSHFSKGYKNKTESKTKVDINVNIKLKPEELSDYSMVSYILEEAVDSFIEHAYSAGHSISFPEIAFMITFHLKKIIKNIIDKSFKEKLRNFIEKINKHATLIETKRKEEEITLLQISKVAQFEEENKLSTQNELLRIKQKRNDLLVARHGQKADEYISI